MDTVTHHYKNVWKNPGILTWDKENQILEGVLSLAPEERHWAGTENRVMEEETILFEGTSLGNGIQARIKLST